MFLRRALITSILCANLYLLSCPAFADPMIEPPLPTPQETAQADSYADLLQKGDYATLDKTMNQIQKDYEEGKRTDINLLHLFRAFYISDAHPIPETKLDAWVTAYPNSYAAKEARSTYLRILAYMVRGSGYANQLQQAQITAMQQYLDRAAADSKAAMLLTRKPILSYYDLLTIAKQVGDKETCKQMLDGADIDDPKNYIVRFKYMLSLETRWGGSLKQMEDFRAEVQKAGLPSDQLAYFDQLITDEKVWLAQQGISQAN